MDAISVAKIGSSDDLKVGEQVVAIGNALGYGQSVTTGIVSAKNRQLNSDDTVGDYDSDSKCSELSLIFSRQFLTSPDGLFFIAIPVNPIIAFIGVLMSWDICDRNAVFA